MGKQKRVIPLTKKPVPLLSKTEDHALREAWLAVAPPKKVKE